MWLLRMGESTKLCVAPFQTDFVRGFHGITVLPKIFLPSSIPNVSGNPFPLWYNDDNIKRIEELAFPNQKSPVRFAFLPTDLSKSEQLQAAWPENATNDMVAKCIDAPEPEDLDASIYREDAGYNELLYDSRDGKSDIKNWGSPVFGAEAYDRYNDPVEVLARRKISTFTDLLQKNKQKTE
ncbi:hypothetical protein BKA69DRAFT_1040240 [Paraphysoderma sedebokerense]|nr:hypothetical protein BKA69DRAFT_1040240 [Paraphysoderma sedebokerense]